MNENSENKMRFRLREGGMGDAPTLAGLEKIIFSAEAWSEEMFRGEFSGMNPTLYLLLEDTEADEGTYPGKVIGYAGIWLIQDEGHITNVGVHPDYRRKGLAEKIVTELVRETEKRGAVRETLEVRVSNEPAIRLYEKLGFTLAGKRRGYYADNHEDAFIYWREKND